MKFGLKLWSSNYNLIDKTDILITEYYQYIELMPLPYTNIDRWKSTNLEFIIHAPHEALGVNLGNKNSYEYNMGMMKFISDWCTELNAKYVILHPGIGNILHTKAHLNYILQKGLFPKTKILIENMPVVELSGQIFLCYDISDIESLLNKNIGFCFDVAHLAKARISKQKDFNIWSIMKFMKLNPEIIHFTDVTMTDDKDIHLNIEEGGLDFELIWNGILCSDSKCEYFTLETPSSINYNPIGDIKNINLIKKYKSLSHYSSD